MRITTESLENLVGALAAVFQGEDDQAANVLVEVFADHDLAAELLRAVSAEIMAAESGVPGDEVAADRAMQKLLDLAADRGYGGPELQEALS